MPWTSFPETLGEGPQGDRGTLGGVSFLYRLDEDGSGPPADGKVMPNDPDLSAATILYISDEDRNAADLEPMLDLLEPGDYLKLTSEPNDRRWALFMIDYITQETGHHEVGVTFITQGVALLEGEKIGLSFTKREGEDAPTVNRVRKVWDKKTDGDTTCTDTPTQISGLSLTFTLDSEQDVILVVGCTLHNAGDGVLEGSIGYKIDGGSFQAIAHAEIANDADGDGTVHTPCSGIAVLEDLAAGSHTITFFAASQEHTHGDTNTSVHGSSTFPVTVSAFYEEAE